MSDLKIEYLKVDRLTYYENNSRKHSNEQIEQIVNSINEFGFTNPILIDENNGVIAGHGRLMACDSANISKVPCVRLKGLSEAQKKAYVIADNSLALNADWDIEKLQVEIESLKDLDFDIDVLGLDFEELDIDFESEQQGLTDDDSVPGVEENPVSKTGDIWLLGEHRVMCGDSTKVDDVALLMNGKKAQLLHADPPYGMGKEGDGVANDNLYRERLDEFQMKWWRAFRSSVEDNGSAYIWGKSEDLWRLWYVGGLNDSERFTFRNEIVWNKETGQGMNSGNFRQYPSTTERCLFFMLGEQGFNNNADNYWDGFDPIRNYLINEKKKSGLTYQEIENATSTASSHYFSKSQWEFPTEKSYKTIQGLAKGVAFKRDYDDLKREFYKTRAYFDNTHEIMSDVWDMNRVKQDERHGHATPKPVKLMERVMFSSLIEGGLCIEPFGGSGSTLIGAELTNRKCYTMELQSKYVEVIVKRWQDYTGKKATHAETGKDYDTQT